MIALVESDLVEDVAEELMDAGAVRVIQTRITTTD